MSDATIALPPRSTEVGAVARLLLAEVRGPAYGDYNEAVAFLSMQKMKLVLSNRLTHNPERYSARGAKNLIDIIKAHSGGGEQFAGFGRYPHYDKAIEDNIHAALDIANARKDARAPVYAAHINAAILVANSPVISDPSPTFLDGWRTSDRGAPSSNSVPFETVGNITFFYARPQGK